MWLKISALFLAICTLGTCCNNGWHPSQDSCYKVIPYVMDYRMAHNYCQIAKGSLAVSNGSDFMKFFNTLPNFDGQQEYWINDDGSWTDEAHMDNSSRIKGTTCLYAKNLNIRTEYCSVEKYFICEMGKSDITCPTGFDSIVSMCLRAVPNPSNYEDAKKFCALQQGELAVLDDESKEWYAKAEVMGLNKTFLVGVRRTENGYKWTNGEEFQPEAFFHTRDPQILIRPQYTAPNVTEKLDCVGIYSENIRPTVFAFEHLDCDEKSSFLCQAKPLFLTTATEPPTTITMPTPSTPTPLQCPHGRNWKVHQESGYCFWETTYETERLNWYQARDFCKHYGGDLASYENLEQEISGLGGARGHYRGLWIGLERDRHDVFHWTDGTFLSFTNWNVHEPNLNSSSKFCVTHSSGTSKWQLDYCGVRRWFICKAAKVANPTAVEVTPETKRQCDIAGVSAYRNQWYEYKEHCYMVHNRKYTWDTARIFCQDNGAHLSSIHSFNETDFILNVMTLFPDTDFWIGLGAHGLHSSYVWSDDSPLDFLYWADNKTQAEGLNICVSFNKRDGSWDNEHCNRLQGVVCKRGINSTYEFAVTEPPVIIQGNCEHGWYNYGNKCYKYFGSQWSQRVDWKSAMKECQQIGASLVSIHSQSEQEFLTDVILDAGTDLWTGLQSKEAGTVFHWTDDSRMDYTNWGVGEPEFIIDSDLYMLSTTQNELCVVMEHDETTIGDWNDIGCAEKKGYLCEKMKNPELKEPSQDPFQCGNISGWYRLGSSCYGMFEQLELTWLQAQAECRKFNANLVTFRNAAVSIFVKRKLKRKDAFFWTGIREKMADKYEYITGSPMFYTKWMTGQPRAASSFMDNCGATKANGAWLIRSCKEKNPFICKSDPADSEIGGEPEIEAFSQTCETAKGDWYDLGGENCYMVELSLKVSWGDAMHNCFRHGGYLASFHSADEIKQLQKYARNLMDAEPRIFNSYVSIGLGSKNDGSFGWVDNSAFDFTNWDEDQPSRDRELHCVKMSVLVGKWRVMDCDENLLGFVCSVPKRRNMGEDLPKNSSRESQDDIIGQKLAVGGIFGIVICVLVILAIVGVTVYYLRPTKQVQPKLLESEAL